MNTALEYHDLANLLPMPTEGEMQLLRESIQKEGQKDPIVLLGGKILDGRSRYEACLTIGTPVISRLYDPETDGPSPTAWVMAKNVYRRHLNAAQRAAIVGAAMAHFEAEAKARLEKTQFKAPEEPKDGASMPPDGQAMPAQRAAEAAADSVQVSATSVKLAKRLHKQAPDLHAQVVKGEISLNRAIEILDQRKKDATAAAGNDADIAAAAERDTLFDKNKVAIERAHGEDFAKSVRDGVVLKTLDELRSFMDLSPAEQKSIRELVIRKRTVRQALKFINAEVTREDKIGDLFLRALSAGGSSMTWSIDGWNVKVSRHRSATQGDEKPAE